MASPKTRARSSFSSFPPPHISGEGVDKHAIEIRSKRHPYSTKNLDENILHLLENALILGLVQFGKVLEELINLIKNLSKSYPFSEVRNSSVKWSNWIDQLSPRYESHWKKAGMFDSLILSKHSINRDENLLVAALCFWNSCTNTFDFHVGPMSPTPIFIYFTGGTT